MKAIGKGKLFRAVFEVDDALYKNMQRSPELAEQATMAGAMFWHDGVLKRHFDKDARGRYGYEPRSGSYPHDNRKGYKPDLVYSGSLRHDMLTRATYRAVGKTIEARMYGRVFNFLPNLPQNTDAKTVRLKDGKGYPNLKREIRVVTQEEAENVAQVVADDFAARFKAKNP